MSGKSGGLGSFQFGREEAVQQLYGGSGQAASEEASDQGQQKETQDSSNASYNDSKSDSLDDGELTDDEDEAVTTPTVEPAPAPPPKAPAEARVQFNNRIKPDRRRILDRYQRKHNTTMQAIVDQMVEEYLERRGLLPKDAD